MNATAMRAVNGTEETTNGANFDEPVMECVQGAIRILFLAVPTTGLSNVALDGTHYLAEYLADALIVNIGDGRVGPVSSEVLNKVIQVSAMILAISATLDNSTDKRTYDAAHTLVCKLYEDYVGELPWV